ncbi:MAG: hypothetical protein DCC56_02910 [Anaerolineae bacterium]|nr:MAG: hypothetical protein DCC56_02910 [Anaerolineae bacterium]
MVSAKREPSKAFELGLYGKKKSKKRKKKKRPDEQGYFDGGINKFGTHGIVTLRARLFLGWGGGSRRWRARMV